MGYVDAWGEPREVSKSSRAALLAWMSRVDGSSSVGAILETLESDAWRRSLQPVMVVRVRDLPLRISVIVHSVAHAQRVTLRLERENGTQSVMEVIPSDYPLIDSGSVDGRDVERREIVIDECLPLGYHKLHFFPLDGEAEEMRVIVVPDRCYMPPALADSGRRVWGIGLQLYALRSRRNWGIGDFTDLMRFVEAAHQRGADAIGLNPLHALYPGRPGKFSPYAPSSRRFLNILYIDPKAVPEYARCAEAKELVGSAAFRAKLSRLRATPLVDYGAVGACKRPVLELLYSTFRSAHLDRETARARAFRQFQREGGRSLRLMATFETLAEQFGADGHAAYEWRSWPAPYRDSASEAVSRYAEERASRVEFFEYVLWVAQTQLSRAVKRCERNDMAIGLYRDLAVGVDPDGADAWIDPDIFQPGATLGAPPDELNLRGQSWGLSPYHPRTLRETGYEAFRTTLQANMKDGGALRIDHILGYLRIFCVPDGMTAMDGGYVRNPVDDLFGVLALESHRNRCLVIGEDLGTVPPGFAARMEKAGVLSYKLLIFEKDEGGTFHGPEDYPRQALAAFATHDLPTLTGFWTGRDIEVRDSLQLFPLPEMALDAALRRRHEREALLAALREAEITNEKQARDWDRPHPPPPELVEGIYTFLARSPSMLVMTHLEDALGVLDQINVPGTVDEAPNWRRKMPLTLDRLWRDPRIAAFLAKIRMARLERCED